MATHHGERMIDANGIRICTDSFGDPTDPTILLVMERRRFNDGLGAMSSASASPTMDTSSSATTTATPAKPRRSVPG